MNTLGKLEKLYSRFDNHSLVNMLVEYSQKEGREAFMNRLAIMQEIEARLEASGNTNTIEDTYAAMDEI